MIATPDDRTVVAADDLLVKGFQRYTKVLQEPLRYDMLFGAVPLYSSATADAFHLLPSVRWSVAALPGRFIYGCRWSSN
jgi:hypothetical protein